jgi:hypothetical protein
MKFKNILYNKEQDLINLIYVKKELAGGHSNIKK